MSENKFDAKATTWDDKQNRLNVAKTISGFLLSKLIPNSQSSLLDYGCGTGLVGFEIAKNVGDACFADTSDGMLTEVRKKAERLNVKNIETINFDAAGNQTLEREFDIIISAMAMHHIDDAFSAIEKITRHLSPTGQLAIADICSEDGSFHGENAVPHNGFNPEDIVSCFENLGLGNITCDIIFEIPKNERHYPIFCVYGNKK